jgi:hypothetical protein
MKRRLFFAAAMMLMLLTSTNAVYSFGFETDINYYLDDAFLDWAGNHYQDCDFNVYDTGGVGSWRIFDRYSCSTGQRVIHRCQQTNGTGGWIDIGCPAWDP